MRPQARKRNHHNVAEERGIVAVRRRISTESQPLFEAIADTLRPELLNMARIFKVEDLGVTVIGFSRFDKRHRGKGPRTRDIEERVDSCHSAIRAKIGALGIYGSDTKAKLAVHLDSEGLVSEVADLEARFKDEGFPLSRAHNAEPDYAPHCSIALLHSDVVGHFQDPRALQKLRELPTIEGAVGQGIVLDPVPASRVSLSR